MPTPLDWHMYVLPLQDFDQRTEIPYRTCMAGVRINEPEAGDFVPAQTDRGSVEGAFLAKATGPERDYVHAWFLGAAGYIQAAEAKKTATNSGTQVRQGNSSGQSWLPIKRDDPDPRFEPAAVKPPHWYDGKFPTDWPATITQGTQEHEQNLTLHPSFFGLVAVNDGGDPKCGTLVHELDDKGRVETSQHLQSIFTVTDLGGGACGAGGKAVALTLGKSKQDSLSGHLPLVEWLGAPAGGIQPANAPAPPSKLTAMLALPGGSPLHSGGLGDRHVIGKDANGDPIVLPHWNPEATIWKIHEGDGPMKFDPRTWEITKPLGGPWQEVHLRWKFDETHSACGGTWGGKWAWQVQTPLYKPEKDRREEGEEGEGKKKPEPRAGGAIGVLDRGGTLTPIPDVPNLSGFITGVVNSSTPEALAGLQNSIIGAVNASTPTPVQPASGVSNFVTDAVNASTPKLIGEYDPNPEYVAVNQCFVAGEIALRGTPWAEGAVDLTGQANPTERDLQLADNMPLAAKLRGFVTGNGQWDGADASDSDAPNVVLPEKESGLVVMPPDQSWEDLVAGGSYTGSGAAMWIPESARMIFGTPQPDGVVRNAFSLQSTGDGDGVLIRHDASGNETSVDISDLGSGGGGSTDGSFTGANGDTFGYGRYEVVLTEPSGGSATFMDIPTPIPVGSKILSVTTRILSDFTGSGITGTDSVQIGLAADTDKWGNTGAGGYVAGTTTDASDYTADPEAYVSNTASGTIRVTAGGFTMNGGGGQIRIVCTYSTATAPTS